MELWVLDENFIALPHIIDTFESLIWTVRYSTYGDFEILLPIQSLWLDLIKEDYYIWLGESDRVMIVEDIEIITNDEGVYNLSIKGRSLESILSRRVVWDKIHLTGNLQDGIIGLLDSNIISPSNTSRRIDNFTFKRTTDPIITALEVDVELEGEELYDVISNLCETNDIGFKVILTEDNSFEFQLFAGVDRSYNQLENPYVVFSPEFDNLVTSSYLRSSKNYKNTVRLPSDEFVEDDPQEGLNRREVSADSEPESKLKDHTKLEIFEGVTDIYGLYKYGVDFNIGDIVQLRTIHGIEAGSRVTEMVYTQDGVGINNYPTFVTIL